MTMGTHLWKSLLLKTYSDLKLLILSIITFAVQLRLITVFQLTLVAFAFSITIAFVITFEFVFVFPIQRGTGCRLTLQN